MAVDVLTDIMIKRPQNLVATYAGDPTNAPAWYESIESVEWRTAPPLQIGSRVPFVAHLLRRRGSSTRTR
jgi:hypothetical protein